jgi:hypothetical protein
MTGSHTITSLFDWCYLPVGEGEALTALQRVGQAHLGIA